MPLSWTLWISFNLRIFYFGFKVLKKIMDVSKPQSNDSILEEVCFIKANQLIASCHLYIPKVASLCDINSKLFIELFSAICEFPLSDIIHHPKTVEDEVHNIQVVIDTLSLDLLNISMSHITGEDIVAGNVLSIQNLLEILEGYMLNFSKSRATTETSLSNREAKSDASVTVQDNIQRTLVCTMCGYSRKLDEFVPLQAHNFTFSCPVCKCPIILEENSSVRSSYSYKDCNSSQGSALMPPHQCPHSVAYRPHGEFLINSSTETNTLDHVGSTLHITTVSGNKKLRPEFERIGVRKCDSVTQTNTNTIFPTSSMEFSTLVPSRDVPGMFSAFSTKHQTMHNDSHGDSCNTSGSPPLNTVIFNGQLKKVHSSNEVNRILQRETMRNAKIDQLTSPKRRMSRSMDDIRCLQQDQMIQTSDSLFENAPTPRVDRIFNYKKPADCFKDLCSNKGNVPNNHSKSDLKQMDKNCCRNVRSPKCKPGTPYPKAHSSMKPISTCPSQRRSVSCSPPSKNHHHFKSSGRRRCSQSSSPSRTKCTQPNDDLDSNWVKETCDESNQMSLKANTLIKEILEDLLRIRENLRHNPLKKSQTQLQKEEATKRQKILSSILRKEIHHSSVNGVKKSKDKAQQKQNKKGNTEVDSVLLEQYWNNLYHEAQKWIQKKNAQNQQILQNSSSEDEVWQKIHQLLQDWHEESQNSSHSKDDLDNLENYYRSQFVLLAESVAMEKRDIKERKKAQQRVLKMMKMQSKDKREKVDQEHI